MKWKAFFIFVGLGLIGSVFWFGPVGWAAAADAPGNPFQNNHLIQVVYNHRGQELATDLGNVSQIDFEAQDVVLAAPGTVLPEHFDKHTTWQDLRVAVFGFDEKTYRAWFATTRATAPRAAPECLLNFINGSSDVAEYYRHLHQIRENGSENTVTVEAQGPDVTAYLVKLAKQGTEPGTYGGFNKDAKDGEAMLSALSEKGYVDLYLYDFDKMHLIKNGPSRPDYAARLSLFPDGSTVINAMDESYAKRTGSWHLLEKCKSLWNRIKKGFASE